MVVVSAISFNFPHHQIPTQKANVVANALSQSQWKEMEDSMDDSEATTIAVEE